MILYVLPFLEQDGSTSIVSSDLPTRAGVKNTSVHLKIIWFMKKYLVYERKLIVCYEAMYTGCGPRHFDSLIKVIS